MCGIVGARNDWLIAQGFVPEVAIAKATREIAWRGPDGEANRSAGDWWLGCARLAISGPRAQQPVALRGGRYVGIMNGAITNARTLWPALRPGIEARETPPNDAWLPLLAVANQNLKALNTLRGHHAFAVADTTTGELTIGQDFYGEKPLHCLVARIDTRWQLVAFASTPAALRHLGMPKPGCNRRLAEWFRYGWSTNRPFRFSARLRLDTIPLRGRAFTTATDGPRWCKPTTDAPIPQPPKPITSLRDNLINSVRECTDSPAPAGLFLSGGLDSSCLALALSALRKPTPAYQFQANDTSPREREAARDTAMAAGLPLRCIDGGHELLEALPRLTRIAGQPLGDPSVLAVHFVAKAAARDGIRIMLGGEGADELLLGYQRYRALSRIPRLPALRSFGSKWSMHKVARYWRAIVAANPIRSLLAVTPPAFASTVLSPEIALRDCWQDAEPMPNTAAGLALASRNDDLENYLPCDLLPKIDVAMMAAGIEGRCPYLTASIRPFGKDTTQLGKRALHEAFSAELPNSVRALPKTGFSLPLNSWFRSNTTLLDMLADRSSRTRKHLRPGGLASAIDRHRRGSSDLGHALYLLLAYEIHLRALEEPLALA